MKYKGLVKFPSQDTGENPFTHQKNIYREEQSTYRKVIRLLTSIIGGLILALIITGGAALYAWTRPDILPYVVELAPWGEARVRGLVGREMGPVSEVSLKYYLRNFVKKSREITSDGRILEQNLTDCFSFVTVTGHNKLKNMILDTDVETRFSKETQEVMIESVIQITESSYQVDWKERSYNQNGQLKGESHYRGIYNIVFTKSEDLEKNPLGIYIDNFNISYIEQ